MEVKKVWNLSTEEKSKVFRKVDEKTLEDKATTKKIKDLQADSANLNILQEAIRENFQRIESNTKDFIEPYREKFNGKVEATVREVEQVTQQLLELCNVYGKSWEDATKAAGYDPETLTNQQTVGEEYPGFHAFKKGTLPKFGFETPMQNGQIKFQYNKLRKLARN